jgi:hypothetical protein
VVEKIEDPASGARVHALFSKVECYRSRNLQVKRRESREAIDVSRSNVFAELVFDGVRKSGVQIVNGNECQVQRAGERAPEQETVGCVKGQSPSGIRLDDRLREIPEELIEIIKVAKSTGVDV